MYLFLAKVASDLTGGTLNRYINHCISHCIQPLQSTIAINHCNQPLHQPLHHLLHQPLLSTIASIIATTTCINHCINRIGSTIASSMASTIEPVHPTSFYHNDTIRYVPTKSRPQGGASGCPLITSETRVSNSGRRRTKKKVGTTFEVAVTKHPTDRDNKKEEK